MSALLSKPSGKTRLGRWMLAGCAVACLLVGGCSPLDLRGDPFPADEAFDWAGSVRKPDSQVEYFGFSNRARQIERDFGAR